MGTKLWAKRYKRTTLLLVGCIAFLLGLVAARRQVAIAEWAVVAIGLMVAVAIRYRNLIAMLLLIVFGLALGSMRGTQFLHALRPYNQLAMQKVTLEGTSTIDAVYGNSSQLSFSVKQIEFTSPLRQRVPGTIKVQGFGETMIYRGDRLRIHGKLYLTRGANQASISFAELRTIGGRSSVIDAVRRKFAAGMQSALPEPLASFGLGLLVGQRNTLPAATSQVLLMVGLTHIIAVSGYNLTILLEAAKRLVGGRSKVLSTVVALVLIAGFLLFAGTSASIVRAAVISVLGLAAWYYGRSVRPLLLIFLAAALTAYADPVYMWGDISWYLSFLAFFGILVLAPVLTRRLFGEKQLHLLPQIALESLCAELLTLPLVLYIFGQMSFVSLLANVLVAALIPLAMLLSLVAGLAGMFAGAVVGWFAWPAKILLTYMLDISQLLSRIPHAFQQKRYLSAVDMAVAYTGIAALIAALYYHESRQTWAAFLRGHTRNTNSEIKTETGNRSITAYTRVYGRANEIRSI